MKASAVLLRRDALLLYQGSDGTIRGCPEQSGRYDGECLRRGSFEEKWKGGG